MCKLINRLVCCSLIIMLSMDRIYCSPFDTLFEEYLDDDDEAAAEGGGGSLGGELGDDYELHYDQRQNGTENYRINLNGIVVAIPGASANSLGSVGLLASNYLLDLADAANTIENQDSSEENDDGEEKPYDFELPIIINDHKDEQPIIALVPESNINATVAAPVEAQNIATDEQNIFESDASTNENIVKTQLINVDDNNKESEIVKDSVKPEKEAIMLINLEEPTAFVPAEQPTVIKYAPQPQHRPQQAHKYGHKKRNKLKLRLGSILNYLKRSQQ